MVRKKKGIHSQYISTKKQLIKKLLINIARYLKYLSGDYNSFVKKKHLIGFGRLILMILL